ncbi:MAG: OsmC family protein [Mucilaginibacter polytrichastri]|nr:OsmC family protein [Mucilaginibacter polytrichastri]
MNRQHQYTIALEWTGNRGSGTSGYTAYSRDHRLQHARKPEILASSDPSFRGNPARYNPEELLVASLSSCHMLWYLHLCADAGVIVLAYTDEAKGTMEEHAGGGRFTSVKLYPKVRVTEKSMVKKARDLHHEAHRLCYIANSCNFPVECEAEIFAD